MTVDGTGPRSREATLTDLSLVDPGVAGPVGDALEWLLGEADLSALHQAGLQQFLWYELPFKWMSGPDDQHRLVAALARYFDLAGLVRYAALCRSSTTSEVLDAWSGDPQDGFDAFRRAHDASGVVPPDVPDLTWGDEMGPVEHDAFWSTAKALEVGVEAGLIRPGARGWRAARTAVATGHLAAPRPGWFAEPMVQAVWSERIERWPDEDGSLARQEILAPTVKQLLAPVGPDASSRRSLAPLRRFLSCVGGGVVLTRAGRLPQSMTIAVADRTAAEDLARLAAAAGLVRRRGRRLVMTDRGRHALSDARVLWEAVTVTWLGRGQRAATGELLLALALVEPGLDPSVAGRMAAVALTEAGWERGRTGRPVDAEAITATSDGLVRTGRLLGWVWRPGRHPAGLRLTKPGQMAARAALRARAVAPVRRPPPAARR